MKVTMSVVNNRFVCARILRKAAVSKDFGLITDVKLTRIGLLVWHLQFEAEAKA